MLSEQLQGGVRIAALMDGVHVHTDALPGVEIPDGVVAYALGAGAGNVVGAGTAVAHGAGFAVGAHGLPGVGKNFGVSHICFLLRIFSFIIARFVRKVTSQKREACGIMVSLRTSPQAGVAIRIPMVPTLGKKWYESDRDGK